MAWISPLYLFNFRMKGKVNSSNDSESDGLPGVCVRGGIRALLRTRLDMMAYYYKYKGLLLLVPTLHRVVYCIFLSFR